MSIKTILVSQPSPSNENNPYTRLKERLNLKIDFDMTFASIYLIVLCRVRLLQKLYIQNSLILYLMALNLKLL